jgi:gamma-D-glutamyl-L-lysine dipeptidyl-peptidase
MMKKEIWETLFIIIILVLALSCGKHTLQVKPSIPESKKSLELMGYTIQAGAFAHVENAARLSQNLRNRGINSTYFKAADGLYKVRFGNYTDKEKALLAAQRFKEKGTIEEFYVVLPENYAVAKQKQLGTNYLREALVKTAQDFIGVPYLWGGASSEKGFDCSGLTMTVYQLNGLNLPRNSAMQYEYGTPVDRIQDLQKGDLVFFALKKRNKVSHVGVYLGDGNFIHASSQGKTIRVDSLSAVYFYNNYMGGRTYL